MRLIDGDTLRDRLQNLAYDDWNQGVSTSWANAYSECADMVEEMPTVEPMRKKGEWERKHDGVYCSCCYLGWDFITGIPSEAENYNFCPNCGADMRGEQP